MFFLLGCSLWLVIENGDLMVIQWDLMEFNRIYDGIASGNLLHSYFSNGPVEIVEFTHEKWWMFP